MRGAARVDMWRREYEAALARIVGGKRQPTCREVQRAKIEADAALAKSQHKPPYNRKISLAA